jgi:hypothetical protein
MTYRFIVLLTLALVLAATAWAQEIQDPVVTVPTLPTAFQNPYKYTPPPISFVPNAPWTANAMADSLTTSNPPDGALSVTGQGKVITSYNQLISGSYEWRISVSTDAGATWTPMTVEPSGTQFDNVTGGNKKDSCICLVMRAYGNYYNLYFKRSTNSGVTWSDTIHVPPAAQGWFNDHPIMATRYPNILVTYFDYIGTGYEGVIRSTDWGDTWNSSQIFVSNAYSQGGCPAFAPAPSTVAYAAWGEPSGWQPNTIWFNKSTDLGATWGTPMKLLTLNMSSHLPSGPPYGRPTHTFPSMVVAPNGTIYLTVMDMLQGAGWDIAFIKSTDQGTTWSTPVRVNDDTTRNADQFDNWMCVDRFNRPHVFWTDNRNYYSSNIYGSDIYYSYSSDGGATWAANERVNDVTPIASALGDFPMMGDYQQIDCDSTNLYCEWSDHRNAHHSWSYIATASRPLPSTSGVEERPTANPWVNQKFYLAPSKPNPVMSGTELAFQLEKPSQASLRVYDLTGKLVKTVLDGPFSAGSHSARWDGRDESGNAVPSGVYFYRLESGGLTATQKLVVAR